LTTKTKFVSQEDEGWRRFSIHLVRPHKEKLKFVKHIFQLGNKNTKSH